MVSEQEVTKENEDRLKKIYYIAVKTRNFEITQLVQRNNFFMIFQGVLLASIIYSSNTVPYVQLMICIAGCYIAVQQTKAAAGAKFWQEYWEAEVVKAEKNLESFYESKSIEPLPFIPMFDKDYEDVEIQVANRLNKINCSRYKSSVFNLLNSKKLILEKPSVSKIPIRVGRCLVIIWGVLAISTISFFSHALSWLTEKELFQGFPNHKESAKQEIFFSSNKNYPLSFLNSCDEENVKNLMNSCDKFQKSDLNSLKYSQPSSQSNEINLSIAIDGKDKIDEGQIIK